MKLFGWLRATDASKRFFTQFLMYSWQKVFLSLTVFAFEGKENALLFCHNRQLFFPMQLSYLRPIFVNLSTEKHLYCRLIVAFWKKDLKIKSERRRNHWRQKRVVFQKTFWTSSRKTGNFEGIVLFLCLVNEISRKSFPNNYRSVEAKFILSKETLKTANEFAFCLLIGQVGSSFFCGRNVSCLSCFFLPFKERF